MNLKFNIRNDLSTGFINILSNSPLMLIDSVCREGLNGTSQMGERTSMSLDAGAGIF